MSGRIIEKEDQEFINQFLSDNHQEELFRGWVSITSSTIQGVRERLVFVTTFRFQVMKQGFTGRSLKPSLSFLDLREIEYIDSSADGTIPPGLRLKFVDDEVIVRCSLLKDLTQACLFAVMGVTHNYPIGRRTKLSIPDEVLEDFRPPAPCSADGLLATYFASCDRMEVTPHNSVLEYLMLTFAEKDNIFDFGEALARADKWGAMDVQALCKPLAYNDTFTELVVVGAFDDDSLQAISRIFAQNKHIDSLIISHTRSGKQGFVALAEQLARGTHRLRHLTISNNSVGDSAIGQLCESLAKAPQVLSTFLLNECSISSKGIRHLTGLLNESQWLNNLKALDISNNSIGKSGTAALASWVEQARCLQVLSAVRCDLDTETLFAHLNRNKKSHLKRLNISENKLTKSAVEFVCEIVARTNTLTNWHLARTQLNKKTVSSIFEFAAKNSTGVLFLLDLSFNDLGLAFAKKLFETINDVSPCHSIGALVLRDTNLGIDGVVRVCEAAQSITRLRSVVFDSNVKATAFKNPLPAGEALAQLITHHKSLRTISIIGSHDYCFKGALIPVFKALATNKTLLKLDIRHNKISSEAFAYLGLALKQNKFLRSLQIDDNRMDIKTLQDFANAVQGNVHLVDPSAIPINDIGRLLSSNKKTKDTLTRLVHEMESRLLRNERFAGKAMEGLRDDEDFVYYESASENELSESSQNTSTRSSMTSSNKKGSHHLNHVPHHHYTHLNFGHAQTQRPAASSGRSVSLVSSSPPATMQHSRASKRPPTSQTTFPPAATSPRGSATPKKVTYANTSRPHASSSSSSSNNGVPSRNTAGGADNHRSQDTPITRMASRYAIMQQQHQREIAQQIASMSAHAQVLGNGNTPSQRHWNGGPPPHHERGAQRAHHHRWYSRGRIMSYALGNMIDQMDDGPIDEQGDGNQAGSPSGPLDDILGESDDEVAPPPVAPPSISPDEYRELKAAEEELHTPPPLANASVSPRNGGGSAGFGFNSQDSNRVPSTGSVTPGSRTPTSRSPSVPLRQGRTNRGDKSQSSRNVSVGNNPYTRASVGTPQHGTAGGIGNNLSLPLSPKSVRNDVMKSAPVSPRYKKRASLKNLQPVRTGKKKSVFDHHRMNQHKSVPVPFDLVNSPPPTKYSAEELKSGVKFPVAIDLLHREIYLSDEEFKKVFGIDKLAFSEMQFPYQLQLKRRVGLF